MCNKRDRSRGPGRCQERLEFDRLREIGGGQIPALDPVVLRGAKIIGLTAGASTPVLVEDMTEASSALGLVATLSGVAKKVEFKLPAGLND
jgi:4-hydroxy-3-methylbut-2-enyl diphosphate reductase IspH